MAFVDAIDVSVGDAILASHVDNLADNTEFNRETAGVTLDMDITTGDGYAWADPSDPFILKDDGTPSYLSMSLHIAADGGYWLPVRAGEQSSVTNANADGYIEIHDISERPGGIPA